MKITLYLICWDLLSTSKFLNIFPLFPTILLVNLADGGKDITILKFSVLILVKSW